VFALSTLPLSNGSYRFEGCVYGIDVSAKLLAPHALASAASPF
jgi:hypothetical protein